MSIAKRFEITFHTDQLIVCTYAVCTLISIAVYMSSKCHIDFVYLKLVTLKEGQCRPKSDCSLTASLDAAASWSSLFASHSVFNTSLWTLRMLMNG